MYKDKCLIDGHEGYIVANKWKETNREYKLTVAFKREEGEKLFYSLNNTVVDFKCDDRDIDTRVEMDLSNGGYHYGGKFYIDLILRKRD